ncbi:hypothetical protein AMECASPLE_037124 [Ameca splendens]|uniref:Secreted protein n=2 Tax=Goodeidae TaxID=28758 RepID=A0ABV1A379_9TELE
MLFSPTCSLVLLLLLNVVDSGRILLKISQRFRDLQAQKNKEFFLTLLASGHQPLKHVKEGRIYQPLDHFNRQNVETFPQVA